MKTTIGYAVLTRGKKSGKENVEEFRTKAQAMRFARAMARDGFAVEAYRGSAAAVDSPFNAPIWRGGK